MNSSALISAELSLKVYTDRTLPLPPYSDEKFRSSECQFSPNTRKTLHRLLQIWIDFAFKHGIVWFISGRTLMESLRHEDMVPWEEQINITVLGEYESIIRAYPSSNPIFRYSEPGKVVMVSRTGNFCITDELKDKKNCAGQSALNFVDTCSFCRPLARIITESEDFINIWLSQIEKHKNFLEVFQEEHYNQRKYRPLYPYDWVFPLKECKLMGMTLPCPKQPELLLKKQYGRIKSSKICENGEWKDEK